MIKYLKKDIKKSLLLFSLRFCNFFRKYDNDLKDKKVFLNKYFMIQYGVNDPVIFKCFLVDQRYWAEKRLNFFRFLFKIRPGKIFTIFFIYCLFLVSRYLISKITMNNFDLIVLTFLQTFCIVVYPFNTTKNQILTQIAFVDYLDDLLEDDLRRKNTLDRIVNKTNEAFSSIRINLSRNELAACLAYHIDSNIIELTGLSQEKLCRLIEEYCCDANGKEFNTLKTILSDFRKNNKNSDVAFSSYNKKLNQNGTKQV